MSTNRMHGLTCDCCSKPAAYVVDENSPHCLECMLDATANTAGPIRVQDINYVEVKADDKAA